MKRPDCGPVYNNGEWYDLENEEYKSDLPFYLDCIKEFGGPVLELCCGTGRLTIPMAETGVDVVGLDYSEAMLAMARKKASAKKLNPEFVQGDGREFKLNRQFQVILIPFNSLAHFHSHEDIESLLRGVRDHLKPDGRFILDMFSPSPAILCRDNTKRYPVQEFSDPRTRDKVIITENNVYDRATQINHIKWYFKVGEKEDALVYDLNMRMFYPQELEVLLKFHGFRLEAKYGDFDRSPFKSESVHQILISRKS